MTQRQIEVGVPAPFDIVGREFVIAGSGAAFEATARWRLLGATGDVLAEGALTGVGSVGILRPFAEKVALSGVEARGTAGKLQVFGDDPSGTQSVGADLNEIPVTIFSAASGWKVYDVKGGDSLTAIAQQQGSGGTTAEDIFAANRDSLTNPDEINAGQKLRVPVLG